jgi:hypothetical protein
MSCLKHAGPVLLGTISLPNQKTRKIIEATRCTGSSRRDPDVISAVVMVMMASDETNLL